MTSSSLDVQAPQGLLPRSRWQLVTLCYGFMVIIIGVDWVTSAGVVVGLLLTVPIVLLSLLDGRRQLILATGFALAGFAIAAIYGRGPISPPSVWVPNRILAAMAVAASGAVALLLQRHRMTAESALGAALSARDTNRLLMSLMAHDLRAPLVAASQALEYVERSAATGATLDAELVADTRLRLRRNLRVIELVLQVARGDMQVKKSVRQSDQPRVRIADEIEREAASFISEAEACGKQIVVTVEPVRDIEMGFDGLVLRQVLAILLDNAIRHARPGPVWVEAKVQPGQVLVSVTDTGPGLSARTTSGEASVGSGIGLELCRTLATRVGGSLDLEQDSERGTRFSLRLPLASRGRERGARSSREAWNVVEGARRAG